MSSERVELNESTAGWRPVVLNTSLRVCVVFFGLVVASGIRGSVAEGNIPNAFGLGASFALFAWAAFASGVSHSTRAAVAIGVTLGLGLAFIPFVGLNANVSALLTGGSMLALLTLGPRAAMFAVGVACLGFGGEAIAIGVFDWVPPHDPQTVTTAMRFMAGFLAFGGGSVAAVHYIIQRLERTTAALSERTTALRRSEAEFHGLFDHVFEGVFRTAADGRLLTANRSLAEMLGYDTPEELLQVDVGALDPSGVDRGPLRERLRSQGELRNQEVTFKRKDGRKLHVLMNARAVRDASGEMSFEGTVVDMTGRKALEEQLVQAGKMEAVGRLAGGVAHDFNNLMTIILGYTDILHGSQALSAAERRHLESIKAAASSASDVTRQLLAFSRKQLLQPQTVDVNVIVIKMLGLLRRLLHEDIVVDTHLAERPDLVNADPGQLEQVIMNLCVNARDAMSHGGRLTISTANVELSDDDMAAHEGLSAGPHLMMSVSDTGIGMDADVQSRIFEPFYSTKESSKGTGLGLATVYGIVRQSGGSVSVQSQPGAGTTFTIHLPRAASAAEPSVPIDAAPPAAWRGGRETVLIVEDEQDVRDIIGLFLSAEGYTVLEAGDGVEALRICERHPRVDLVVTDVIMPDMGGPELAAQLAVSLPLVRVLMMSGYTDDAILKRGATEPGRAILQKPFTRHGLLEAVRRTLDEMNPARGK